MTSVLWLAHPEDTPQRGYWDQAFVEDLFAGRWRPSGLVGYRHHEVRDLAAFAGSTAVVVLPARSHPDPEDSDEPRETDWLNGQLAYLAGVVLILTGDEEQRFARERVRHPNMRLWVMDPHPGAKKRDEGRDVFYFGSGYTPHVREHLGSPGWWSDERLYDWSFSGQNTHDRRWDAVDMMWWMEHVYQRNGVTSPTAGFTLGMEHDDYVRLLAASRSVVCPSGPVCVDSFRVYEALEAGAVPIVDNYTPTEDQREHWALVTGSVGEIPFPSIDNWDELPAAVARVAKRWPIDSNHVGVWWNNWCWRAARRLRDDLAAVGVAHTPDDLTVVITTSPTETTPNIDHLEQTISSIRNHIDGSVPIVLAVDGVRPEQADLGPAWDRAVQRILHRSRYGWANVEIVYDGGWRHQAGMFARALERVETPVVLFSEHDTPLMNRPIPVAALIGQVIDGEYDFIRLHHEARILEEHLHLMVGDSPVGDVWPTVQWSQRPHFASTAYYRDVLEQHFTGDSRTMIEDTMHSVVQVAWDRDGRAGWNRHRLGVFCPKGKDIKRSEHLDARGSTPKFGMER